MQILRSATRISKYPHKNQIPGSDSQKAPKIIQIEKKFRLICKVFSGSLFMHKN